MLETIKTLLNNEYFVWCAMAVVVFLITQVLKLPIKAATSHIKNERTRKMVNATILLIPFALGCLFDFLYSTYYLKTAFNLFNGLGYCTAGISLYEVVERFFKVKTNNPYDTEEGQAIIELVEEISKDGKIDKEDTSALEEFYRKVK